MAVMPSNYKPSVSTGIYGSYKLNRIKPEPQKSPDLLHFMPTVIVILASLWSTSHNAIQPASSNSFPSILYNNTCTTPTTNTSNVDIHETEGQSEFTNIDTDILLFCWFAFCLNFWFILSFKKTSLGKDIFGYKGDCLWIRFLRKSAEYSWWYQFPLVFIALTWPNNIFINALTIYCTLTFGGGWYSDFRNWFQLEMSFDVKWNHLFSLLELSHHASISYVVMFEDADNKLLYRPILCYAWFAHLLGCITHKYSSYLTKYGISNDFIWKVYWRLAPFVLVNWYIHCFMVSNNNYLSLGVIMLYCGRWLISFNCQKQVLWQSESYYTILGIACFYYFTSDISLFDIFSGWQSIIPFVVFVGYLQQKQT